jgi:acetyl-CoA carboxylase carboxyltransferase component/biotin carboxyl carrier protein
MEANPRLQVEHTVTEEVSGVDLVQLQIRIAAGERLADLGLDADHPPEPQRYAVQFRLNAESMNAQGEARPATGTITRFDLPGGPGVRVDTHGRTGYAPSPQHDALLAKLIVATRGLHWPELVRRARRALGDCHIEGLTTNLGLLRAIADRPEFESQALDTLFVQDHLGELLAVAEARRAREPASSAKATVQAVAEAAFDPALQPVRSPMPARVVEINVQPDDWVPAGRQLMVVEAMKMQHLVTAPVPGRVAEVRALVDAFVEENALLVLLMPEAGEHEGGEQHVAPELDRIRPDLQRVIDRHAFGLDLNRPEAVAKRHAQGGRTARENVDDLCDAGSFLEYGALAVAAQARRRGMDDLVRNTPHDGMVTGIGTINAAAFGPEASRCVVLAYDYTVLAGTQGMRNHHKTDRLLDLAHQLGRPVVLFAEGGGGRPGDTDMPIVAGLNNHTFTQFAALSGKVPVVGIVSGRCFAGNAALLGCADVIIATANSNIGMGGPAMIEGGGIGSFKPEDIGPSAVHNRNGVIDVLVADEAAAVQVARRYLSYFQGAMATWTCDDPRALRHAVPENRLRVYDVRAVMRGLFDTDSELELRQGFGAGVLTAFARIEGRPVGVIANNPAHLGGAIDADAADKAARFMQLCDAHGLPIVSLTDTPGFMVGPDIEAQAQVRHVCRMFVVAAHLTVPFFAVVLRKGYGLGAQAMTAGGFDAPVFTVAWPSGEFGAMGLEGAVRLGYRRELEAQPEGEARDALYKKLVAQQYENGSAINMATTLEIDAVIDPADTRSWLVRGLDSAGTGRLKGSGRMVDAW